MTRATTSNLAACGLALLIGTALIHTSHKAWLNHQHWKAHHQPAPTTRDG